MNVTIRAQVDVAVLQSLVYMGYLTMRPHPDAGLVIWNYTAKCQYEHYWTPETLMCRGLITTPAGEIVARPFPKFFNLDEYQGDLPLESFTVTAKMDGSLGILYWMPDGEPRIATRGSFTSDQALRATQILQTRYSDLVPNLQYTAQFTYLFEIIYPENRIVVDYGEMEDIVLLAMINIRTGEEFDVRHLPPTWPIPVVTHYDGIKDIAQLRAIQEENEEGFVIRFQSGLRLKLKFAEYVRLHALLTQCTARQIWQYLKDEQSLSTLLDRVPDEFNAWVRKISKDLSGQYRRLHSETHRVYKAICAQAQIPMPIPAPMGAPLNLRDLKTIERVMERSMYEQFRQYPEIQPFLEILHTESPARARPKLKAAIWEKLYPPAERPFKIDEEALR